MVYVLIFLQLNAELTVFGWQPVEKGDVKLNCLPEGRITKVIKESHTTEMKSLGFKLIDVHCVMSINFKF